MQNHNIMSRLKQGDTILLDGGTGSELHRRGVNVSKGASAEGGAGAWSAPAVEDAPEILRQIHEDYRRAGADLITANSYNTNRGQLSHAGLAHKMEEYSRRAIEIACEARDAVAPAAFVGGAIAPTNRFPTGWDPSRVPPGDELLKEWGDQVAILNGGRRGCDLDRIDARDRPRSTCRGGCGHQRPSGLPERPRHGGRNHGERRDDERSGGGAPRAGTSGGRPPADVQPARRHLRNSAQAARRLRRTGRRIRQHWLQARHHDVGPSLSRDPISRHRYRREYAGTLCRVWPRLADHGRPDHRRMLRDDPGPHRGARACGKK